MAFEEEGGHVFVVRESQILAVVVLQRLNMMPFIMRSGWFDVGIIYWYRFIVFWKVFVVMELSSILIVRSRKLTSWLGSSKSQDRMPKLLVSFLKLAQVLAPSSDGIQIPKMSSMKRLKTSKCWRYFRGVVGFGRRRWKAILL